VIRQYPLQHDPYDGSSEDSPVAMFWYGLLADSLKRHFERIHVFQSGPPEFPALDESVDHNVLVEDDITNAFRTFTIRGYANDVWQDIIKPPDKMYAAFLQRLKIMAGFSLARRPPIEEGRFRYAMGDGVYEVVVTVRAHPDGSQDAMIDLPGGNRLNWRSERDAAA